MTRVFFHTPYAGFSFHSGMEAVLEHALTWRGARCWTTTCDGLFTECDVFRRGIGKDPHRVDTSCLYCQAQQATELAKFKRPFTWLGRYLTRDEPQQAAEFAAGLPRDGLLGATWDGLPVGEWAQSSAFYQFRLSRIDLDHPGVVPVLRSIIEGTVLSAMALRRVFDEVDPHVLITFNGRFFSHRVAVELARARGCRVFCHERGALKDTIKVRPGGGVHGLDFYDRIWSDWHNVPLQPHELQRAVGIFRDRRYGRNLNWKAFSPRPSDEAQVRAQLRLDDRPVVSCFTTSDDEWLAIPERREGPFPNSLDWIPATLEAARQSPDLLWVVRFHPNLIGNGTNHQALGQARALREQLPENCRFVMPDEVVSSYTLADLSACGVVYGSTMGVEMASRGMPVVSVARGWYGRTALVLPVDRPDAYLPTVREAVARPRSFAVARWAHRFLHHLYVEEATPFPWVERLEGTKGRLRATNTADLAPGKDPVLDALCDLILHGTPLQPAPPPGPETDDVEDLLLLQANPHLRGCPDRPTGGLVGQLDAAQAALASAPARARSLAEGALAQYPEVAQAWRILGLALARTGQARQAHRALVRATQLDPEDRVAWDGRLVLEAQRGDRAELQATLAQADEVGVEHPLVDRIRAALG